MRMSWKRCEACKDEYFQNPGDTKCPNCNVLVAPPLSPKASKELKASMTEQAIEQANVVGKFGEFLQPLGYGFMAIFFIALVASMLTDNWVWFFFCLFAIPLTFIAYNVFGSALRALSLYIQVKLK